MAFPQIVLFGVRNPTSAFLCTILHQANFSISLYSSSASSSSSFFDLTDPESFHPVFDTNRTFIFVSLAPIHLFASFLDRLLSSHPSMLEHLRRVIVVSSSSSITKRYSFSAFDKSLAHQLIIAEETLQSLSSHDVPVSILQPTLVYGSCSGYRDSNVTTITKLLSFLPFIILPRSSGLRQPIHAFQLAHAIHSLVASEDQAYFKVIPIGGDEELTYLSFICRIRDTLPLYHPARHTPVFTLPNRLFCFLCSPILLVSPKIYESVLRMCSDLSDFPKVSSLTSLPSSRFPFSI